MLRDIDYDKLKRSFEFLVQNIMPQNLLTEWSDPIKSLERNEKRGRAVARRGLFTAIGDFVEASQDFSKAQLREVDKEMADRGAYTLSFFRSRFSRRKQKN